MAYICPECHHQWTCDQIKIDQDQVEDWIRDRTGSMNSSQVTQSGGSVTFMHEFSWECQEDECGCEINVWVDGSAEFSVSEGSWELDDFEETPQFDIIPNSTANKEAFSFNREIDNDMDDQNNSYNGEDDC